MNSSTKTFLKQMHIDVESVAEKLGSSDVKSSANEIESYINIIGDAFLNGRCASGLEALIYDEFIVRESAMTSSAAAEVLDSIRHALSSFVSGGVTELYFYQENEVWYPKVVLTSTVDVSEIEDYPEFITVYRGCSKREFESGNFKQSWSTSIDVANEFAFGHYAHQPWFSVNERVIVKAIIPKHGIYLTRLDHHEREVVLNPDLLSHIEKCT